MTAPALSVAEFAEQILKQPLWPHQRELVESDAFITTVAAARRAGKTEAAEVMAMHCAFSYRACKVLVLSAGQDAARRVTESIGQRLNGNPLTRGAVVDDFATRIRLVNGSEIISLPASQKQVRGFGKGVRLVILDEAGFMPSELWTAAHYTALDERRNGSRIMLMGSPWGPADHFFRRSFLAGRDGDPDHRSFQWRFDVNPNLDAAYLERQRSHVSPAEYAAEVLGEWSDAIGSLFTRELLEQQTADIVIPPLADLHRPARGIVGVDWGVSYDRCAAVGVYRLPVAALNPQRPAKPVFVALPYVWRQGAALNGVVDELVRSLGPFRFISPEVNGIGSYPSTELRRRAVQSQRSRSLKWTWNLVTTTSASKTTGYGTLLGLLEQEQLVLPREPALLRQLAGLKFEQRERGFTRIAAEESATHDDVADALYLATLPHKPARAHRVICHLAHLAGSSRAPSDARVPELACDVVETGGGLKLHTQPTLQSVAGVDFSTYAPLVDAKPEGFTAGRFFVKTTKEGMTHA
jgi:Terminase large subunit, T4likevirus-type, N-terminal